MTIPPASPPPLKAYVLPFVTYVGLIFVADMLLPGSARFWLYPAQILLCGGMLIRYWSVYRLNLPKKTGFTLITAIIVLFLWISPQEFFGWPRRIEGFDPTVFKENPSAYAGVVFTCFVRMVVIVPLIEEIFWRGFLLRFLVKEDFESVPFGLLTRNAFIVVTIGFCLEHKFADWPAALVTGVLYNLVAWRTRSLASCVLAHAVTNLLLGIYILRTGQWGFW